MRNCNTFISSHIVCSEKSLRVNKNENNDFGNRNVISGRSILNFAVIFYFTFLQ